MNKPRADSEDESRPLDPADEVRLRNATRRGFAIAGVSILSGYGAWRWLTTSSGDEGLSWPLRRVIQGNERLARATFQPNRLARDFGPNTPVGSRVNGMIGMDVGFLADLADPSAWRLSVTGGAAGRGNRMISLAEIKALPRFEQRTELKCIEGWSMVVHWAGARLADLAAITGLASRSGAPYDPSRSPKDLYDYVGMATRDGGYHVGLDSPSALHPQTLLCYEMNGQPLSTDHGAPLRLAIPLKYGIKNIKQVQTIRFTDRRPDDYWAKLGYDYHAGH